MLVCGDSHTCTHGGVGTLGFGVGWTELTHVLATQTVIQRRPKTLCVKFEGTLRPGVTPKDMILYLIGQISVDGGTGYAVEYAGSAIRAMSVEGRLTICNLSVELGSKMGLIAPDETTYALSQGAGTGAQGCGLGPRGGRLAAAPE
ncbi:MAG: aconitase family protein [Acetobacteraceae bacterium]